MSTIDILAPWRSDDTLYRRSQWVAKQNKEQLESNNHAVVVHSKDQCTEGVLQKVSVGEGLAFFGHGQSDQIHGSDERPLFPGDAASRLKNRWVHVFACDAGDEWAKRIVERGEAKAVVGYTRRLSPEWNEENIPSEILEPFRTVVTAVSVALADGMIDEMALRQRIETPLNTITRWCDLHPGEARGIRSICEQLYKHMKVTVKADIHP